MTEKSDTPESSSPPPGKPRRRWIRRVVLAAVGAIVLIAGVVALLPVLLSTPAGKGFVVGIANRSIAGNITIDDISLAWFSGQRITGLELTDPDGAVVLRAPTLDAPGVSLYKLVNRNGDLGHIHLDGPVATIERYADGSTNLGRALRDADAPAEKAPKKKPSPGDKTDRVPSIPANAHFTLDVSDGHITYREQGAAAVEIDVSGSIDAPGPGNITAMIKAAVRQGTDRGEAKAVLQAKNLFDVSGRCQPATATIEAQVELSGLPVDAVDRLLNQGGTVLALLGPTLDARVNLHGSATEITATIMANSQHLDARVDLTADSQRTAVAPGSSIKLSVAPEAFDHLVQGAVDAGSGPAGQFHLAEKVDITVTATAIELGHADRTLDLASATGGLQIGMSDVVLETGQGAGPVIALRNTRGLIGFAEPATVLRADISTEISHNDKAGRIDLHGRLHHYLDSTSGINPSEPNASIQLGLIDIPMSAIDALAGSGELVEAAIGPRLSIQMSSQVTRREGGGGLAGAFEMTADADFLSADVRGHVSRDGIVLTKGGQVLVAVQPHAIELLGEQYGPLPQGMGSLSLAQAANARFQITSLEFPFTDTERRTIKMGIKTLIDQIVPTGGPRFAGLALRGITVEVPDARSDQPINLVANATFEHGRRTGTMRADVAVTDAFGGSPTVHGNARVEALPTSLIETIANESGQLGIWLGESVDSIDVELTTDAQRAVSVTGRIESARLQADVGGRYSARDRLLSITDQSWIEYVVTPQAVDAWQDGRTASQTATDPRRVSLTEPAVIRTVWGGSQIGWLPESQAADTALPAPAQSTAMRFDPDRSHLHGSGTFALTLRGLIDEQSVQLSGFKVDLVAPQPGDLVSLDLSGNMVFLDRAGKPHPQGRISSSTQIEHLLTTDGAFNRPGLSITTDTHAESLPVALVDVLAGPDSQLTNLLGESADVRWQGRYTQAEPSDMDLSINATRATAHIPARIGERIELREDATATLAVSPELSKTWLKRINPLFLDAVGSKQPLKLKVKPEGLNLPVSDFSFSRIKADAELDLGTLQFQNRGLVNTLRRAFKRDTSQQPTASFTPLKVHLEDGVISYSDMTMTMDNLVLGFRGRVDQANKNLDMTMAVSGQTMAKAFGLRDVIEPGYEFEIPMRGTFDEPIVDYSSVVSEATRLAAKKYGYSEEVERVGEVLDILKGGKKQPPPDGSTDPDAEPVPEQDPVGNLLEGLLRQQLEKQKQREERRRQGEQEGAAEDKPAS